MVENPKKYIKKFALLNTEYLTFHVELGKNIESNLEMVRNYGMKCGLAINPDTEFDVLKPYLEMVDIILVMSVIPGYGGQAFMPEVLDKVKVIKDYIKEHKLDIVVSIDGGINNETGKVAKDAGSDILIAGSYITNGNNYQEKIDELRNVQVIDIKDVITLDDNDKYMVVSKANYNNDTYFYIMDIFDNKEIKILRLNENNKLSEFDDQNIVQDLFPLFFKETLNMIIPND